MRVESDTPATRMGGWWHHNASDAHTSVRTTPPAPKPEPAAMASPEDRDRIYSDLLASCGLSAQHEAYLLSCGIDTRARTSYATLNGRRAAVLKYLSERYSVEQLRGTPGFWFGDQGELRLAAADGLLLAVRDAQGRIARMQCRVEHNGAKSYLWLSSSKYGGPSSGAIAHVALGRRDNYIYITEGIKKAEVIASRTGYTAIGLPGHASMASGLALLDELIAAGGGPGVIIALDEDNNPDTAALVDKSRNLWITECLRRDLYVKVARWQGQKGIDDLLLTGQLPTLTRITNPVSESDTPPLPNGLCEDLVAVMASPLPTDEKIGAMALRISEGEEPGVMKAGRLQAIANAAGMQYLKTGKTRVGQIMTALAARGVVRRDLQYDSSRKQSSLFLASNFSALPQQGDIIPRSANKEQNRKHNGAKRKCPVCGGTDLVCLCQTCLSVMPLDLNEPNPVSESDTPPAPDLSPTAPVSESDTPPIALQGVPLDTFPLDLDQRGSESDTPPCLVRRAPAGKRWRPYGDPEGLYYDD